MNKEIQWIQSECGSCSNSEVPKVGGGGEMKMEVYGLKQSWVGRVLKYQKLCDCKNCFYHFTEPKSRKCLIKDETTDNCEKI